MVGKTNNQGTGEAVAKGSNRGLTLLRLGLPQIVLVVIIVLACGYVSYLQYAGLAKKAQQVQHVADAEKMAASMGGRLIALGDQVAMQARADDALADAIRGGDLETVRKFESSLKSYFPEAVRIRVVRPIDTNPDLSITPPIGYACLDLARQAEAGSERPPLELHLHGLTHEHLDLVRPIMHQGKVVASLMVTFSTEKVGGWLKGLGLESGYVELQQGWDGPMLGSVGEATEKREVVSHRAMISGSGWQLSYWAKEGLGMVEAQKLGFLAIFAVAAVVIAVVMFFYSIFLSGIVKRDLYRMAEFMVESSRGKRFHSYPVKMRDIEEALEMMEPVLSMAKPSNSVKQKAEDGDGGVSDMMFMDFGEITVEESEGEASPKGKQDKS